MLHLKIYDYVTNVTSRLWTWTRGLWIIEGGGKSHPSEIWVKKKYDKRHIYFLLSKFQNSIETRKSSLHQRQSTKQAAWETPWQGPNYWETGCSLSRPIWQVRLCLITDLTTKSQKVCETWWWAPEVRERIRGAIWRLQHPFAVARYNLKTATSFWCSTKEGTEGWELGDFERQVFELGVWTACLGTNRQAWAPSRQASLKVKVMSLGKSR